MALPSSGAISMNAVAVELGISSSNLSLNDSRVRGLAGVSSGQISMSSLRGKSNAVGVSSLAVVITSGQVGQWSIGQMPAVIAGNRSYSFAKITFADGSKASSMTVVVGLASTSVSGLVISRTSQAASSGVVQVRIKSTSGATALISMELVFGAQAIPVQSGSQADMTSTTYATYLGA